MKRTFRKIRAVIRRSSVTKFIVTSLLTGAGILAFLVMIGESDPESTSFAESMVMRAYAAGVLFIDYMLFKVAYRMRLLTNELYQELRKDNIAVNNVED